MEADFAHYGESNEKRFMGEIRDVVKMVYRIESELYKKIEILQNQINTLQTEIAKLKEVIKK